MSTTNLMSSNNSHSSVASSRLTQDSNDTSTILVSGTISDDNNYLLSGDSFSQQLRYGGGLPTSHYNKHNTLGAPATSGAPSSRDSSTAGETKSASIFSTDQSTPSVAHVAQPNDQQIPDEPETIICSAPESSPLPGVPWTGGNAGDIFQNMYGDPGNYIIPSVNPDLKLSQVYTDWDGSNLCLKVDAEIQSGPLSTAGNQQAIRDELGAAQWVQAQMGTLTPDPSAVLASGYQELAAIDKTCMWAVITSTGAMVATLGEGVSGISAANAAKIGLGVGAAAVSNDVSCYQAITANPTPELRAAVDDMTGSLINSLDAAGRVGGLGAEVIGAPTRGLSAAANSAAPTTYAGYMHQIETQPKQALFVVTSGHS